MINKKIEEDVIRDEGFVLFASFDMEDSVVAVMAKDDNLIYDYKKNKVCSVNRHFPIIYQRLALQDLLKKYEKQESDVFYQAETIIDVAKYIDDNNLIDDKMKINIKNIEYKKER